MHRMTDREFESAVEEALANIPERFLEALENVAVVVEDEPDDYHFDILDEPDCRGASIRDDELLGLYDGVSLPDRADGYDGDLPDVITVFKGPHERCFGDRQDGGARDRPLLRHRRRAPARDGLLGISGKERAACLCGCGVSLIIPPEHHRERGGHPHGSQQASRGHGAHHHA